MHISYNNFAWFASITLGALFDIPFSQFVHLTVNEVSFEAMPRA